MSYTFFFLACKRIPPCVTRVIWIFVLITKNFTHHANLPFGKEREKKSANCKSQRRARRRRFAEEKLAKARAKFVLTLQCERIPFIWMRLIISVKKEKRQKQKNKRAKDRDWNWFAQNLRCQAAISHLTTKTSRFTFPKRLSRSMGISLNLINASLCNEKITKRRAVIAEIFGHRYTRIFTHIYTTAFITIITFDNNGTKTMSHPFQLTLTICYRWQCAIFASIEIEAWKKCQHNRAANKHRRLTVLR